MYATLLNVILMEEMEGPHGPKMYIKQICQHVFLKTVPHLMEGSPASHTKYKKHISYL